MKRLLGLVNLSSKVTLVDIKLTTIHMTRETIREIRVDQLRSSTNVAQLNMKTTNEVIRMGTKRAHLDLQLNPRLLSGKVRKSR